MRMFIVQKSVIWSFEGICLDQTVQNFYIDFEERPVFFTSARRNLCYHLIHPMVYLDRFARPVVLRCLTERSRFLWSEIGLTIRSWPNFRWHGCNMNQSYLGCRQLLASNWINTCQNQMNCFIISTKSANE